MGIGGVLEAHLKEPQETVNVRLVVIAQTFFFLHRLALVIEIFLRDFQRAHAVTLQPQGQW